LDEVGRKTRELALRLPAAPGGYRFSDAAGRVLYLGQAVSLHRRVVSYWGDLGDRRHLTPMVARAARVEAVVCGSAHEAARLERNLLRAALPAGRSGHAARRPAAGCGDAAGMGGIRPPQRRTGGPARFPAQFHGQKRPRRPVVTVSRLSGTAS
jgi:hypothetical protein